MRYQMMHIRLTWFYETLVIVFCLVLLFLIESIVLFVRLLDHNIAFKSRLLQLSFLFSFQLLLCLLLLIYPDVGVFASPPPQEQLMPPPSNLKSKSSSPKQQSKQTRSSSSSSSSSSISNSRAASSRNSIGDVKQLSPSSSSFYDVSRKYLLPLDEELIRRKKHALRQLFDTSDRKVPVIYNRDSKVFQKYMKARLPRRSQLDATLWREQVDLKDIKPPEKGGGIASGSGRRREEGSSNEVYGGSSQKKTRKKKYKKGKFLHSVHRQAGRQAGENDKSHATDRASEKQLQEAE